jgi:parallel beta-helix repeat protein
MRRFVLAASLIPCLAGVAPAGDLTPPAGPVAPTMKTLAEVEPRIAVNATNTPGDATNQFIISQPGSYYLTGDITGVPLKNGIAIRSPDVTIDLMGFSLIGVFGSRDGITMEQSAGSIVVRNGTVTRWSGGGVLLFSRDARVEDIHSAYNGDWGVSVNDLSAACSARIRNCSIDNCQLGGITAGVGSVIQDCAVQDSGIGIAVSSNCLVESCAVHRSRANGITTGASTTISLCNVSNTLGFGIIAANFCLIDRCTTVISTLDGIRVGAGSSVVGCHAGTAASANGIHAPFGDAIIENCQAMSNGPSGIRADGRARIHNCTASSNALHGIHITNGGTVTGCSASSNSGDGILVDAGGLVAIKNNTVIAHSGAGDAGIRIINAGGCHLEGNFVSGCDTGYIVSSTGNTIVRNSATACTNSYSIGVSNLVGQILSGSLNNNPHANFAN